MLSLQLQALCRKMSVLDTHMRTNTHTHIHTNAILQADLSNIACQQNTVQVQNIAAKTATVEEEKPPLKTLSLPCSFIWLNEITDKDQDQSNYPTLN